METVTMNRPWRQFVVVSARRSSSTVASACAVCRCTILLEHKVVTRHSACV